VSELWRPVDRRLEISKVDSATCRGRHLRAHRAAERRHRQLARGGPPLRYPDARRPPSTGAEGTVAQAAATEGASAGATAGQG
jgi:hypothetical protein